MVRVVNRLYESLAARHAAWKLKLHGTIIYDAQQRHTGIMRLARLRDAAYLRRFLVDSRASEFTFAAPLRWALYLATGGAHWFREAGIRALLRDREVAPEPRVGRSAIISAP
jgi:hypothetical protein